MKLLSSGCHLPNVVTSLELENKLGIRPGTIERESGVSQRHYAGTETPAEMAASAIRDALSRNSLDFSDIDLLINASATPQQIIPSTATLVLKELNSKNCFGFDVDSTCTSFITATVIAQSLLSTRRFRRICVVSSEIASRGLDWDRIEICGLFGDAAVAFIFEDDPQCQFNSLFETYPQASELCRIIGGGTTLPGYRYNESNLRDYLFHMDGPKIYKFVLRYFPSFVSRFLDKCEKSSLSDFDHVIPHQASNSALKLLRKRFGIPERRFINNLQIRGNCMAASIPLALHESLVSGRIEKGADIAVVGTGAGISFGAMRIQLS